jgi:uncharacterized phage protein (TIGR02220 family)
MRKRRKQSVNNVSNCKTQLSQAEAEAEAEEKNKKRYNVPFKSIISHLNSRSGTSYRHTSKKTRSLIEARVREGFTEEDFFTVIDKKTKQWLKDQKMSAFLRPETLFGTKFESYLNEIVPQTDKIKASLERMANPGQALN